MASSALVGYPGETVTLGPEWAGARVGRKFKSRRTCSHAAAVQSHRASPSRYSETCPNPFFPAVSWNLPRNLERKYAAG